jgi:hypothetical protein
MRLTAAAFGLILVVGGLTATLYLYSNDLRTTAGTRAEYGRRYDRYQCIGDLAVGAVAEGELLYVRRPDDSVQALWHQRLLELTSPDRRATDELDEADVILEIHRDSDAPCVGIGITAERR